MKTRHFLIIIALVIVNVWLSVIIARYEALCHKQQDTIAHQSTLLTDQNSLVKELMALNRSEFSLGATCGAVATAEEFNRLAKEHPDRPIRMSEVDPERCVAEALKLTSKPLTAPTNTP
jgi:hypothetical protein